MTSALFLLGTTTITETLLLFTNSPVLTYDRVVWEADDGTDKYIKPWYATQSSDLPSDFTTLAEQVS